eukprot:TRINITY_DN64990_c0_g1_i1.p1 TRINITY_DN64990_c0_g1~~TRINITY_DN64990_c0_g1_i1.p1  ORF type:complete len:466 (-),score=58.27 TRINITY_DN64990_c0_g1_i1:42-1415(-)
MACFLLHRRRRTIGLLLVLLCAYLPPALQRRRAGCFSSQGFVPRGTTQHRQIPCRLRPRLARFSTGTGGSNMFSSTANIAKNIIGAGSVALPLGAAQVIEESRGLGLDEPTAKILVLFLFLVFAALNAFGFCLIGEVCERTGASSYQAAWRQSLGDEYAWLPSVASIICCLTGAIATASVVGDTATDILAGVTGVSYNALGRDEILSGIAVLVLLPLCLLPSLSPLAFASTLGLAGIIVVSVVMVARCLDGSYAPGGSLHDLVVWKPSLTYRLPNTLNDILRDGLLFVSLLSNAFAAHYNAPSFYAELQASKVGEDAARPGSKLGTFRIVTLAAFALAGILFSIVTLAGIETFGTALQPFVLNNYASADSLAVIARTGLLFCVLFEYPLLERCFRVSTAELLGFDGTFSKQPAVAVASVSLTIAVACVPNLGLDKVNALGGSLGRTPHIRGTFANGC